MELIKKENGDYHLLINNEIKSLQEFNITKEDCDILTLGYSVEKMAAEAVICNGGLITTENETEVAFSYYHQGFKAHKELVKDKFLLTKEDLEKIFEAGRLDKGNNWYGGEFEQFFQSLLPKTEWECIIDEQGKLKLI